MKALLDERVRRLLKRRADLEARAVDELNQLDRQIAELERLIRQWDTVTVDQALAAVQKAGLTIKVDA